MVVFSFFLCIFPELLSMINDNQIKCVVCRALPLMLDMVRGPERLPADDELQEMLRGKLRILQTDSAEVQALFMVQPITYTHTGPVLCQMSSVYFLS